METENTEDESEEEKDIEGEEKTGETDAYVKDINEILSQLNLNKQPVKELQK